MLETAVVILSIVLTANALILGGVIGMLLKQNQSLTSLISKAIIPVDYPEDDDEDEHNVH